MEWFHNVGELLTQTDKLYERLIALGKPGKLALTKQKVYEQRKWDQAKPYIDGDLDTEIARLGLYYIPKVFQPGPAFVFPLTDAQGIMQRAQTRPMPGSILHGDKHKYYMLGDKDSFLGPTWIGNDAIEITKIVQQRRVLLVEGGFDLLACRVLMPELASLSPLTKWVGKKHVPWLKMLGVRTLYLMFDNENTNKGGESMRVLREDLKDFEVVTLAMPCSGEDPSSALQSVTTMRNLNQLLQGVYFS